jgi:hypothetical protein
MVVSTARVLLDTLLNDLMRNARSALNNAPTDTRSEFFALDLRARLKASHAVSSRSLEFSSDPRVFAGTAAAGGSFAAGSVVTLLFFAGLVPRVVTGLVTLIASASAFRVAFRATTPAARRAIDRDVSKYLSDSEAEVNAWLGDVETEFDAAFDAFLSARGLKKGDG